MDTYRIYLVNEGADPKLFWCFLTKPDGLPGSSVFANSSAHIVVPTNYDGEIYFDIPVQYSVDAGAGNEAVGLDVRITSHVDKDLDLGFMANADYATCPPPAPPTLKANKNPDPKDKDVIVFETNRFDKVKNDELGWYGNATFGIQTAQGFIGTTWVPTPQDRTTIQPKLSFFITTGEYRSNTLADFTEVSTDSQEVVLGDFDLKSATVTLTSTSDWTVEPGKPKKPSAALSEAGAAGQKDTVVSVDWAAVRYGLGPNGGPSTILSGTLRVGVALTAAYSTFVLAGVKFSIAKNDKAGDTSFAFSYNGEKSADYVKSLFEKGATIDLSAPWV